jgi:hypothetical protein
MIMIFFDSIIVRTRYIIYYFFTCIYDFIVLYIYEKIQEIIMNFLDVNVLSDVPITNR